MFRKLLHRLEKFYFCEDDLKAGSFSGLTCHMSPISSSTASLHP